MSIPFLKPKGQKGDLFVILKNPSKATSQNADVTISKVCYVAYNNAYSNVTVYNLFPYRSTNAVDLIAFINNINYKNEMNNNLKMIAANTNNKDVIAAWGTNTISSAESIKNEYNSVIDNLISTIKPANLFYVKSKNIDGYPLHGQRWSHEDDLSPY